jgi:microcin C transport system ATP-binding protein
MSDKPFLSVQNLSIDFTVGSRVTNAVKGISFNLSRGETLAIVGESGSGKSVSALSLMQLLPYPTASHGSQSSILFKGEELIGAKDRRLRDIRGNEIGMIFQEPQSSLNPLHRVSKQINEVLIVHKGLTKAAANKRTLELMNLVGIRDPEQKLNAYPHELSGGQRQRVMIAMALANEPELLIADEPTTALDVTIQAQILELIQDLQKRLNMGLIFISHDLGVVRHIADRVIVMKDGVVVEEGSKEQIFDRPQHPYTIELINADPSGEPNQPAPDAPVVVETDNIKVHFPIRSSFLRRTTGYVKAVDGISLKIRAGQTVGVVGESGSGKTTLGLGLLKLVKSQGPIVFMGKSIENLNNKELRPFRAEMQIVFQDPFGSLSPRLTVGEIIGEGLELHSPDLSLEDREKRIIQSLTEVDLDPEFRHRFPHEFSGGQRQRVSVARAMVLEPSFLVLDEPTSALDRSVQSQLVDLLRDLQKRRQTAFLFISHDLRTVRALADEIIVMRQGKVIEQGSAEQIFDAPQEAYTQSLLAAAFDLTVKNKEVIAD